MAKKEKERTEIKLNDYVVVETDKRTVVIYSTESRGQIITGVAKCNKDDEFDLEVGKQIAYKRCQLIQRKRDLDLVQRYIDAQEYIAGLVEERDGLVSRNFQRAIQKGYIERAIQWQNIKRLKNEIEDLGLRGAAALTPKLPKTENEDVFFADGEECPAGGYNDCPASTEYPASAE